MNTLEDIKKKVKTLIGESISDTHPDGPTYYGYQGQDDEMNEYINDAIEELMVINNYYKEEIIFSLEADKSHYRIESPSGGQFLHFSNVRVNPPGKDLSMTSPIRLSRLDVNWMKSQGTPQEFFIIGNDIFRPYPYPSEDGIIIEALGVVVPPPYGTMGGSTTIPYSLDYETLDLREDFISAISLYTAHMMMISFRQVKQAYDFFNDFLKVASIHSTDVSNLLVRAGALRSLVVRDTG